MRRRFCVIVCFEDVSKRRFVVVRHAERGWELPGGRLEAGEGPMAAAVREFVEETGHDLRSPRLLSLEEGVPWDHVVEGTLGDERPPADRAEVVREWRLVSTLREASPLSFPDDPYEALSAALGRSLLRPP